jgi:hypothetical protein
MEVWDIKIVKNDRKLDVTKYKFGFFLLENDGKASFVSYDVRLEE